MLCYRDSFHLRHLGELTRCKQSRYCSPRPGGAGGPPAEASTFPVTETFDGRPFEYRMELAARRPGYRVYRLRYPSPVETPFEANNVVPAEYYLPDGIGPDDPQRPAVICLHILGGQFELVRLVGSSLAARPEMDPQRIGVTGIEPPAAPPATTPCSTANCRRTAPRKTPESLLRKRTS